MGGALIQWLWEDTDDQEIASLNPGAACNFKFNYLSEKIVDEIINQYLTVFHYICSACGLNEKSKN